MRRVVITGLGMLTPLGRGVKPNWERLIKGENGFRRIDRFEAGDLAAQVAAMIPMGRGNGVRSGQRGSAKERRRMDDFIVYGLAAARSGEGSGWTPEDEESRSRTGVMIGSGIGGLASIAECAEIWRKAGRAGFRRSSFPPA
jgi:3-oxoacyl-[acyl-carrier-protein] synthase II